MLVKGSTLVVEGATPYAPLASEADAGGFISRRDTKEYTNKADTAVRPPGGSRLETKVFYGESGAPGRQFELCAMFDTISETQ